MKENLLKSNYDHRNNILISIVAVLDPTIESMPSNGDINTTKGVRVESSNEPIGFVILMLLFYSYNLCS